MFDRGAYGSTHVHIVKEALQAKLLDPDEKVRAAVCRVYTQIDYETALHHVSEQQLRSVAGRGVDKKVRDFTLHTDHIRQAHVVEGLSSG